MDTRLRNQLHDLASEMPVDLERSARPTLRRARRRRAVGAAGAVVAVVAFVAVGVSALRLVAEPTLPANTGPNPSVDPFPALWPETDPEMLEVAQREVDEGHMPLRVTPGGTATLLATNLLGWDESDVAYRGVVGPTGSDPVGAPVVLEIWNRSFGDAVPPVTVELRQLGDTGPNGIWSVVGVSTPLIESEVTETEPGVINVSGSVTHTFEGLGPVVVDVFDGPTLVPPLASARSALTDKTFVLSTVTISRTPDGEATLLLTMPDATGASLGAVMTSIETPVGEISEQGPYVSGGLPSEVAVTAQRIYDAAQAGDVDGLRELLDPNTFVYNLDDGSDPTEAWRANPSELDIMVEILEMPWTSREIDGYGTFYFWPYLVNSDLENLTPQERADFNALGFSDAEIQLMVDNPELGYQGPRLAIDENGEWRNFITVGE
jgi:hypothetical protein